MNNSVEFPIERDSPPPNLTGKISFDAFDAVVNKTVELLNFLSDSAGRTPIINIAEEKTEILTGDFLLATSRTLESISACSKLGNFSDANMLLRKYRDDMFLFLYILETDNNKTALTEDEMRELIGEEITFENLYKVVLSTIDILSSGIKKNLEDQAVDAWFDNTAENGEYYKLIDIKNYLRYLKTNALVSDCIEKHKLKEPWENLGRRQNNYTHNNGRSFLTDNTVGRSNLNRALILLEHISKDIAFLTSYFLMILILIKPIYIASFDYVEFMDCGIEPPEDCHYWVAPVVQEYIDTYVSNLHSDLKQYLKENNPYGMKII